MSIECIELGFVNDEIVNKALGHAAKGQKAVKAANGGSIKPVEAILLDRIKRNLEMTKKFGGIKVTGTDIGSEAEKVTGIKYQVNKALVTFGRITGLGYKAIEVPEARALELFDDNRAVIVKYYGQFDENMYATKVHQRSLGINTAYEEPSANQRIRFERWISENRVMELPLLLSGSTVDDAQYEMVKPGAVWKSVKVEG